MYSRPHDLAGLGVPWMFFIMVAGTEQQAEQAAEKTTAVEAPDDEQAEEGSALKRQKTSA
eukprot:scaffold1377_cov390-Prasinococcus_capsulatus_cf.AAC.5